MLNLIKRESNGTFLFVIIKIFSGKSAYNSFRYGADDWAPARVTEIEAAREARRTASGRFIFSDKATVNAPLNTSPAAVVSTAFTTGAGMIPENSGEQIYDPHFPKVMITFLMPRSSRERQASEADLSSLTWIPVRISASVSFGVIRVRHG